MPYMESRILDRELKKGSAELLILSLIDDRPRHGSEISEELAQNPGDRYDELRKGGASGEEAQRAAIGELADSQSLKRELGRVEGPAPPEPIIFGAEGRPNMIADLWQDARYAVRMLRRTTGFTSIAVLCMTLGIGGQTNSFI